MSRPLMKALKASQTVDGIDLGHVLTGIDAMMQPGNVAVPVTPDLPNEAWATWAGDLGSAAGEWAMDKWFGKERDTRGVHG